MRDCSRSVNGRLHSEFVWTSCSRAQTCNFYSGPILSRTNAKHSRIKITGLGTRWTSQIYLLLCISIYSAVAHILLFYLPCGRVHSHFVYMLFHTTAKQVVKAQGRVAFATFNSQQSPPGSITCPPPSSPPVPTQNTQHLHYSSQLPVKSSRLQSLIACSKIQSRASETRKERHH